MNFSALNELGFSFLRPFLKICRWALKKMSWNCKNLGMKGSLSSNFRLRKLLSGGWRWRRKYLILCLIFVAIGLIVLLISLNNGLMRRKVEAPDLDEDSTNLLLEHFNVSKEHIQVLSAKNVVYQKQYELAIEKLEANGQCPVPDENTLTNLDIVVQQIPLPISHCASLATSSDHQFCEKEPVQVRALGDQCKDAAFYFTKVCWWILLGIAISWKVWWLCGESGGNDRQKQVQQQELPQQPQLLQHLQQQQAQASSRIARKWWEKLLVIFVSIGVMGSIWLFSHLNEEFTVRRKETIASMCDERARMLQDQFNVSLNHVHALAFLVSTFHHGKQPSAIDQKTFEEYADRTAFERPLTSGVAYAIKLCHSERENFEKRQGWTIKKMESEDQSLAQEYISGNLDPAPIQDEYAPVIFSQQTISHIVSIDMMSGKEDRENILRARASGKGVLTSPFKLLKSNNVGVILTFAVYNTDLPPDATPEHRINATLGYFGGAYDFPSLVEKLLHQLASKHTIVVNVYDTTNASAPIRMYGMEEADLDETDRELVHVSNLDFGDPARRHEMHCRFKQKRPPPWTAIAASIGVLVITLLLGHIFHAAINRIAKFERDYQKMMDLKHRAEAADIAKSQFLATVSHEIRTPMNGVLGMLQMLMDTNLDATQLEYAQTAHASGKDLISLINEVLDQAKIESGRLELEAVAFDLRAVLDKVLSLCSGRSHEKRIELAVYVSDQVPEVVIGDPGRFRQIITNLVGNSIKFTKEKGHVFVSVHLADEVKSPNDVKDEVLRQSLTLVQDRPNTCFNTLSGFPIVDRWRSWQNFKKLGEEKTENIKLLVTVEDAGVGIPLEAQGRIFMPFMQADSSTSRTYGGTGIGLSISKRLVELMGGEIGFFSEPGTGSTFSFTAAFARAEEGLLESKRQRYDPAVSELRGLRALVIDDKSIRAEVTRYHLQRLGLNVKIISKMDCSCSHLSTRLEASPLEHLALIFIDKDNWDDETSITLSKILKELRANSSNVVSGVIPKFVLLATNMSATNRNELRSAGLVDSVLIKPLRLSALVSCIQEATGFMNKRHITRRKPSSLGSLLKDKRILVVDDNVVNRRVAEGAIRKYGAIVSCVDSGKAALALLKPPHKFDACFMDLQMPEMDGFEATRQIRCLERKYNENMNSGEVLIEMNGKVCHWHTPILATTADVIQATNEKCLQCGMDDYISKPFDEWQLYSAVARFFESG
ncbi:PREDICTED: histidine kinase 2-like isoform X1 [Ipomoea nil]|uniref:histidine kinase 2-like isoform X1 n=2 Tax=Ipomoea nil TaxID=35883 RepID=UPI00090085BB|nr:PREDICTED: histidine kinase 2-like isoform X1 [Ipomoea nil]XP_019162777.1 PREDICTED: histidine kinase 2-like isoform X1 [Ipomoea nil]